MLVDNHVFLLSFGLLVAVQGLTGASPGKALLGIRVVRPDGTSAGVLRSFVREAAWIVDGLTLLVPIALWTAWFTPGHRRVGDWVAGTYVIRAPSSPPVGAPGEG